MKETIFYLEGRGGMYLYHFFIYNLGGLYYILNKNYSCRNISNGGSILLENKDKIVKYPTTEIKFPIKIYMKNILPFQKEVFEIIKDKFELVDNLDLFEDYEIVSIFGETCNTKLCDNPNIIFPFIRNLFLENMKYDIIPGKRIFITRKNSESYHSGVLKRYILNENEIMEKLKEYNFEFIQLEDYSVYDKIKLFMQSETIISSHSGCLTLLLFANYKTNVIEILNKGTVGFYHNHYIDICNTLGLKYNRYTNIDEDRNGNFNLNFDEFKIFLNKFI